MDHYDEIKNEPFSLDNKDSDTTDQRSQAKQPSTLSNKPTPRKIKNESISLNYEISDKTDQRSETKQPSTISSNSTPRKHPRAETVPQHTTTQLSPIHIHHTDMTQPVLPIP